MRRNKVISRYSTKACDETFDIERLCMFLGLELRVEYQILLMQSFAMMTTALGPAVVQVSDNRQEAICLYQMSFLGNR
jgi:hypothetical protein